MDKLKEYLLIGLVILIFLGAIFFISKMLFKWAKEFFSAVRDRGNNRDDEITNSVNEEDTTKASDKKLLLFIIPIFLTILVFKLFFKDSDNKLSENDYQFTENDRKSVDVMKYAVQTKGKLKEGSIGGNLFVSIKPDELTSHSICSVSFGTSSFSLVKSSGSEQPYLSFYSYQSAIQESEYIRYGTAPPDTYNPILVSVVGSDEIYKIPNITYVASPFEADFATITPSDPGFLNLIEEMKNGSSLKVQHRYREHENTYEYDISGFNRALAILESGCS